MNDKNIIVALDFSEIDLARKLIDKLDPAQCRVKVGSEMFTRFGQHWVKELMQKQFDVFLDLKFHDIPNTVAKACRACADLGVWMLTIHATGGMNMMKAAHKVLGEYGEQRPQLIAVTVLTSLNDTDFYQLGFNASINQQVEQLAKLAALAQLDGVVCSALEASILKQHYKDKLKLIIPGIRLTENKSDDQQRITTPISAMKAGADYLVIGRPITQALDPQQIISKIIMDISQVAM